MENKEVEKNVRSKEKEEKEKAENEAEGKAEKEDEGKAEKGGQFWIPKTMQRQRLHEAQNASAGDTPDPTKCIYT